MSLRPIGQRQRRPGPPTGIKKRRPKRHFTTDGIHRYCTKRLRGKDELVDDWTNVDCPRCMEQRAYELSP